MLSDVRIANLFVEARQRELRRENPWSLPHSSPRRRPRYHDQRATQR